MIGRPPRSTQSRSSSASDVYKRQSSKYVSYWIDKALSMNINRIQEFHQAGVDGVINACLLYTSPSPRDRTRSRMPSSA